MKIFLGLFLIAATSLFAAPSVEIYFETTSNGYNVLADNNELCPVVLRLDLTLVNLESEQGNPAIIVLPAEAKQVKINTLKIISKLQAHQFSHSATTYFGDPNNDEYDVLFEYKLPFKKGESYATIKKPEDPNEETTDFSVNFAMPSNTEVRAVRGGLVVEVVDSYEKSCDSQECEAFKNYILVYHQDGTFAEYGHLKKGGSLVKKGDRLDIDQSIGYSGNSGRAELPKLHLEIFLSNGATRTSIKTNFLLGDGSDRGVLQDGVTYTRNY